MPFTPEVDRNIRNKLYFMLKRAHQLDTQLQLGDASALIQLCTELYSLMHYIDPGSSHFQKLRDEINQSAVLTPALIIGVLRALHQDYQDGMFDRVSDAIETQVNIDYMSQAEQLLGEGMRGQFDHVPAAVLAGAVLEDALRRLCQRQNPPIPITKPNGDSKTLGTYIDDLKAAGLFNELKAKQLRAWADIRNAAAHGEFDKFTRADVEQMINGIKTFLADYL